MNRHLRWFFALLILLTGSFAFLSGTGYANPGGFDVPEIQGDFEQFDHAPGSQKEQPIHNTEVQAEEKGFWDKITEPVKEGWQWFKNKGSEFLDWTIEAASAFWEAFEKILSLLTSVVIVVGSFFKGFFKAVVDAVKGIIDVISNPIDTLKNLFYAITHPIDTIKAIWQSISESFMRDVIHGDAKSRAEWFGYALGQIALAVVGTKGVDKVGKLARGSKLARKGGDLLGKLPAPVQKVFTKDFWKNAASSLSRRLNINWKNALITGAAGLSLAGLGFFGIPKIAPVAMKVIKCAVYDQPADSYLAIVMMPGGKCGEKKTLYHYTNEDGLKGILSSKKLNPSLKANNPKDARYGDGQYLSDIEPGTKRPAQLSAAFIRIPWQGNKFSHYIEIDVSGLKVVKGREHVYVIPNLVPLDISNRIVSYGKVMEEYIKKLAQKEAEDSK